MWEAPVRTSRQRTRVEIAESLTAQVLLPTIECHSGALSEGETVPTIQWSHNRIGDWLVTPVCWRYNRPSHGPTWPHETMRGPHILANRGPTMHWSLLELRALHHLPASNMCTRMVSYVSPNLILRDTPHCHGVDCSKYCRRSLPSLPPLLLHSAAACNHCSRTTKAAKVFAHRFPALYRVRSPSPASSPAFLSGRDSRWNDSPYMWYAASRAFQSPKTN